MTASRIRSVAVIGDGPAGTTLASYLARAGVRVALFARGRPPLVVGESLVPAVIPFLRELGVEDEVRSYAVHKPGATFVVRDGDALAIRFDETCTKIPGYAYNVPRDRFDATHGRRAHAGERDSKRDARRLPPLRAPSPAPSRRLAPRRRPYAAAGAPARASDPSGRAPRHGAVCPL
jgi:choline dehydrogenase-like flavoprotein